MTFCPKALQYEDEIAAFVELVREEMATSYLEIGAKFGGALWRIAEALRGNSNIVAVDLPYGTVKWEESRASLERVMRELRQRGHATEIIWGNSTNPDVIQQVRSHGPFDVVLIDANHTMPFLEQDWKNYGSLGRMVAFHDIAWKRPPEWNGYPRIEVPQFWARIKGDHKHHEIKLDPTGKDNGFGIIWQ